MTECYLSTYISNRQYYIINVHVSTRPTSEKATSIRQDFYDNLGNSQYNIPNLAVICFAGGFNAKMVSGHTTYPTIVEKYGKRERNSNGECQLDIVQKYDQTIANTLFKHKVADRTT